jgi:hypothetical protein
MAVCDVGMVEICSVGTVLGKKRKTGNKGDTPLRVGGFSTNFARATSS